MNIGRVYTVALTGMHTDTVTVQGFISQGLPHSQLLVCPMLCSLRHASA